VLAWAVLIIIQTLLQVNAKNTSVNFIIFTVVSGFGTIYIYMRVRETNGLSYDQLKKLYYPDEIGTGSDVVYDKNLLYEDA